MAFEQPATAGSECATHSPDRAGAAGETGDQHGAEQSMPGSLADMPPNEPQWTLHHRTVAADLVRATKNPPSGLVGRSDLPPRLHTRSRSHQPNIGTQRETPFPLRKLTRVGGNYKCQLRILLLIPNFDERHETPCFRMPLTTAKTGTAAKEVTMQKATVAVRDTS